MNKFERYEKGKRDGTLSMTECMLLGDESCWGKVQNDIKVSSLLKWMDGNTIC